MSSVAVPVSPVVPTHTGPQETDAEVSRILGMVAEGKLSAADAHDLLKALGRA